MLKQLYYLMKSLLNHKFSALLQNPSQYAKFFTLFIFLQEIACLCQKQRRSRFTKYPWKDCK